MFHVHSTVWRQGLEETAPADFRDPEGLGSNTARQCWMITWTQKWGRSVGILWSPAKQLWLWQRGKILESHVTHVPRQPDVGLGQLFNAAVKRADTCAAQWQCDLLWSSWGSVEGVGEQGLLVKVKGYIRGREGYMYYSIPRDLGCFMRQWRTCHLLCNCPLLPPQRREQQRKCVCYNW